MSDINIFEYALRTHMRFPGFRGNLQVEDLWELSPRDLDQIFKGLKAELKAVSEESLLDVKSSADKVLEIKIAIVTRIVEVKLAEAEAIKSRAAKRARKQELLGLLADKQNEELKGKSSDELKKLIDELSEQEEWA